jgi:hypothetical protein
MAELAPGTVFAGHRIDAVAGRGGMGIVYRATHLALDLCVALKIIAPEYAEDEVFRERFKLESRLAAGIDNPHVIPIRHAGEEDGLLYVTMRFVEGTDLRRMIRSEGRLEPGVAVEIVRQVGEGLDAAHAAGLVHRDVKPANVLLEPRGDALHAYLTDFGLTRLAEASGGLTGTGVWVGTVDYASPEQIRGAKVDARTDVYALGCVLYAALSGEAPYARDTPIATVYAHAEDPIPLPSGRVGGLPEGLDAVVKRALAKDPDDRFQSAGQLGRAAIVAVPDSTQETVTTPTAAAPPPAASEEVAETVPADTAPAATRPHAEEAEPTRRLEPTREIAPRRERPRRTPALALAALGGVALAAVLAVLAFGGGGDGEEAGGGGAGEGGNGGTAGGQAALTPAAFTQRADGVCTEIEQDVERVYDQVGTQNPTDPQTRISVLRERADVVRKGVRRLRALQNEAPPSLRAGFETYAETRQRFAAALDDLADANEAGASTAAAQEELDRLLTSKIRLGDEMGMDACADQLPAADQEAVKQLVADWLSGNDPVGNCATHITSDYLASAFGGDEGSCAASLRDSPAGSDVSSEIKTGVDGVHAAVDAVVDGVPYKVDLDEEDGTWKIDGVTLRG